MGPKLHGSVCQTCRRRGRKCTKELPSCQTCVKKGLTCEGYTWKWPGIASRGKLANKTRFEDALHPSQSPGLSDDTSGQQDNTPDLEGQQDYDNIAQDDAGDSIRQTATRVVPLHELDIQSLDDSESLSNEIDTAWHIEWDSTDWPADLLATTETVELLQDQRGPARTPMLLTFEDMDHVILPLSNALDPSGVPFELKFILNYHLSEVASKLCVDNSVPRNPYRDYVHPLAVQRPQLLYACAALASVHFSTTQSDHTFYVEALRLRGKALRRLQEFLWSEQNAVDEANLGTILMLTLCDICLGIHSNFDGHFAAAKRLIQLRGCRRTQNSFVEQYISWLDIMSAASTSRRAVFSSREVQSLRNSMLDWSYDVFPCPPDLFEILTEVSEYSKSTKADATYAEERVATYEAFKERILCCQSHSERGIHWLHLTEAYRYAILLYTIRLLHIPTEEDELSWLVHSIYYHAKSIPSSTGWSAQLLWPLFHVGLEIQDDRRQLWLRQRLTEMESFGGFRNVRAASDILERVWRGEISQSYEGLLEKEGLGEILVV